MNKAIFIDRDGVINELIFNPNTNEYESPHEPKDLVLRPDILDTLKKFNDLGYYLFIISNQPSYAKGKTSLENIKEIHQRLQDQIENYGINIKEYYYCYHHPDGIILEYSGPCECRKPKPYFINKAAKEYDVDLSHSWMIGDQDTDIECGINAGVRTIQLINHHSQKKRGVSSPLYSIHNLSESIDLLTK
jgi:D-glycero-D-manno-heptose 1,7-bisphosphate phosphatase